MDGSRQYQDFFRVIYGPLVVDNKLSDGHKIRIYQKGDNHQAVEYFDDIAGLLSYCGAARGVADTYFTLSTTNGAGGTAADLQTRTVLGFDFDGGTASDVMFKLSKINLRYHALVDSGHGFHAYLCIQPTNDHKLVKEVQARLCEILEADPNAAKSTQLLRVPGTINHKGNPKPVSIVQMYPLETVKRYDISRLHRRFCRSERVKDAPARSILATTKLPPCLEEVVRTGSIEGERHSDLCNLVVILKNRGKSLAQILALCRQWDEKSDFRDSLEYRVEYAYKNQKSAQLNCKGCEHFCSCHVKIESDFDFPDEYLLLKMSEYHAKCLKPGGARSMVPNDLVVYGILKIHKDGLTLADIQKETSYKGEAVFSEKTLRAALKNLVDGGFVEARVIGAGGKKLYAVVEVDSAPELTFYISGAAVSQAVKKVITPEELRLYTYIRYLHNQQLRDGTTSGNLFQCSQQKIADELDISQGRVAQMIGNLVDEKIMMIYRRQQSKSNGFDYNIYRLVF